jgi:DNA-binding NarL/FixJ family response regulator
VVVTDACLRPAEDGGLAFVRGLRDLAPRIGVVVLSRSVDPTYGAALFETGSESRAYLLKGRGRVAAPGWLGDAISEVAAGRSVVDPKLVDGLFTRRQPAVSPVDQLTAREREVLALIATGMSNGAIAAELWLTKRAVEKYVNAIFATLGLRDDTLTSRRVAATLAYLEATDEPAGDHRLRRMATA